MNTNMFLMDSHLQFPICSALEIAHCVNSYCKHMHRFDMSLPLFYRFSRRRRIYVSMIVSDTLEHSERLAMMRPLMQSHPLQWCHMRVCSANLLRLTSKTPFKLCIIVRKMIRKLAAPLTKGNDAEGELMLSIYLSGAICNKHNHNG